jgi:hypothetical protein
MTEENHLLSFIKIQSDTIMALNDLLKMLTMPKVTKEPRWKEWRGLTNEEFQYCVELKNLEAIVEEVEAKLKQKNT